MTAPSVPQVHNESTYSNAGSVFISSAQTRVFLALLRVYERDGQALVSTLAAEVGMSSKGGLHTNHLVPLRDAGLVTWEDGRSGISLNAVRILAEAEAAS